MRRLIIGALLLMNGAVLLAQGQEPDTQTGPCVPSDATMCLNSGRFAVSATWQKPDGSTGQGHAVPLTDDTGYFWFFDAANIEVATKILNACGFNSSYWVFASGLTNLGVKLDVVDTAAGASRSYQNPVNLAYQPVQDTAAFGTCSTPTIHTADLSGSWIGQLVLNNFAYPAAFSLVQSGAAVAGALSVYGGGGGSLTGTVSGDTFNFSVNEVSPCTGSFSGSATASNGGREVSGNGNGNDCHNTYTASLLGLKTFVAGKPAPDSANVAGLWDVSLVVSGQSRTAVMALIQNGSSVTGTVVISGLGSGSIAGSIIGQTLNLTVNEISPCLGIFLGGGTIATGDASASGQLGGTDCGGNYQGAFSATKR